MNIEQITLLDVEQYDKFKDIIPVINQAWWLQGGNQSMFLAHIVSFVAPNDSETLIPVRSKRYVRPALVLSQVDTTVGEKVDIFAETWTVLDVQDGTALVLCDRAITLRIFDKDTNNWDDSNIKKWLEGWLKRRQKTADPKRHAFYKTMSMYGLGYLEKPFLNSWLAPMTLVLPIGIIMILLSLQLTGFTTPEWLRAFAKILLFMHALMELGLTVLICSGPHKDTLFRHDLNIAVQACVYIWALKRVDYLSLTVMLTVLAICMVNHIYLHKIKYYS